MGRLTAMPSRLGKLEPRLRSDADASGHSRTAEPWRKWYSTAEWKRLKADVHIRDRFTCQHVACGRLIIESRERIADHKIPHRGDRVLFFSPGNVWTLCKTCHDGVKQAEERRARGGL